MAPLEDSQRLHNRIISATHNNSGSNDPKQHKHDLNNKLISSAGQFAAGATLGLSEEETLALMSRQLRRQQRKDDSITMDDVRRQFAQSAKSLSDVSNFAEVEGVSVQELPEVDPFGEDQGRYYEYSPDDNQYEQQQLERLQEQLLEMEDRSTPTQYNTEGNRRYDRRGNVVLKTGVDPTEYDELLQETGEIRDKSNRELSAPRSAIQDAYNRLENARREQEGFNSILASVLGGQNQDIPGAAELSGRMEEYLNPAIQRGGIYSLGEH